MSDTTPCPHCNEPNDTSARFCASCGASLAPEVHCPTCHTLNPLGNRFCLQCGSGLGTAAWAGQSPPDGAVIDGVWERGSDELVRRVDPEDARRFLGNRSVRVPPGTVGAVVVDGVVDRVVPPGERTTISLFDRAAEFFLKRPGRTAFFLIDQRPVPVPFVVQARAVSNAVSSQATRTQVLVSFSLPRGDRAAIGTFLTHAMGDKPSFGAAELHALVRPDVVRITQETLERLAGDAGAVDFAEAEATIRKNLQDTLGPRHGLLIEVSLAPLTTVASMSLHLGTGPAPRVRTCVACRHELPVSMVFCDACGARQPTTTEPATDGARDATSPLFTSDGQQIELDLVVRVQGMNDDFSPARLSPAIVAAAAAHLRQTAWSQVATASGFAGLETVLMPAANEALTSFGLKLVALSVLDVRTKTGQWLLSARADLERAKADVTLGRDWLAQRDEALDLEALTLQQVLKDQAIHRDAKLAEARATMDDREAREALAARASELDKGQALRQGDVDKARAGVRQVAEVDASKHQSELQRLQLEREAAKNALEDARKDADEARQIAKLEAMARIDREIAQAEHAETLEKRRQIAELDADRMIAIQAAELAKSPGGAAFAQALGQRAGAESERRHAESMAQTYDKAMAAMAEVAASRAQPAPVVAAPITHINTTGDMVACATCGAQVRASARFCGACGATRG